MDVHRSRFVAYPTAPITAVAFSRSHDRDTSNEAPTPALKLAIARQNGNVELWNPSSGGRWSQETVFVGDGRSIDGLAWTRDPDELDLDGNVVLGQARLFSIAASPAVMEWDLARGVTRNVSTGNFSEVWCFAAQPRMPVVGKSGQSDLPSQKLVAGCDDGTLVLLSTRDGDLQFRRFLARSSGKKARCMSVTWQTRERVVAGFVDSTIRVYDARSGANVRTMSLGTSVPGAPKNTIVWQVKCLPNGDIVAGDSTGDVTFWDGRSYSLAQRIVGHESDCLDIVVSGNGKTLFTGSLDGRIAQFKKARNTTNARESWARTHHRRTHQGDVKCMSAYDGNRLSVVASGGSDMSPIIAPLRDYGKDSTRTLPNLPQTPPLTSAPHARLLVSWWEKSISIWRIARHTTASGLDAAPPPRRLVAKITLNTKHHIRSVAISPNGKCLAAATASEVKLFQLSRRAGVEKLSIRKLETPKDLTSTGAHLLAFSPNGKWLGIVTPDSEVHMARLAEDASNPKHFRVLEDIVELDRQSDHPNKVQTGFRKSNLTITRLAFASDSSAFVTSDASGRLDAWVLQGEEDAAASPVATQAPAKRTAADPSDDSDSSDDDDADDVTLFYGQQWLDHPSAHLLPQLDSMPVILSFRPLSQPPTPPTGSTSPPSAHRLWILTAHHEMHELDLSTARLSAWSRAHPTSSLPEDFRKLRDGAMGAIWDLHSTRQRLWLYGNTWMLMLDVDDASDPGFTSSLPSSNKKRRRQDRSTHSRGPAKKPRHARLAARICEDGVWRDIPFNQPPAVDSDDDSSNDENVAPLASTAVSAPALSSEQDIVPHSVHQPASSAAEQKWWCSFRYRPILGIVPLEQDGEGDDALFSDSQAAVVAPANGKRKKRVLEVLLVERPKDEA